MSAGNEGGNELEVPADPNASPLPVHRPRRADVDPRAAKRAERQVATLFMLSAVATVVFCIAYVQIPKSRLVHLPVIGGTSASNLVLGSCLAVALLGIGTGAIHWAKKLMPDEEIVQQRHPLGSDDETTEGAAEAFARGVEESGFVRRPLIRRTLLTAMALVPLPALVLLRDLGPQPGKQLAETIWRAGIRPVVDVTYLPVRPEDIPVGGVVAVVPENLPAVEAAEGNLDAAAKAAVILVRMDPSEIRAQQGPNWDYEGILAYSKICTHVGCPVGLYEQRTHHLLCPCHQSTFDLADAGNVIFGPAARRLPQLAITVDADGYLVARQGFTEPVGPSYWERG